MTKYVRFGVFLILIGIVVTLFFVIRDNTKYPRPTREFYVNDYAERLSDAAEAMIVYESAQMYDISKDYDDGGTQVVIATFAAESVSEIQEKYNATDIYRQWGIGERDMGVLILFFFVSEEIYVQIEPGYRMEPYLLPAEQDSYVETAIDGEEDISRGAVHLLYLILIDVYDSVYDLEYTDPLDVKMSDYDDYALDYIPSEDDYSSVSMSYLVYLFSPFSSWGMRIFSGIMALIFFGLGGGFVRMIGGGGRSGGMGIFRRRR